jgi:hypothetical protein
MNQANTKTQDYMLHRFSILVGMLFVAPLVSGRFANYGRLKHNDDVTRAFQIYQVESENNRLTVAIRHNKQA